MCDQLAAFDVCDHEILLSKLAIYGLQDGAIAWFSSYLENRGQKVYVEGAFSETRKLERAGVPQGGNLSPLLYNVFCSDLPEAIFDNHDHDNHDDHEDHEETEQEEYEMHVKCKQYGKIVCYADDCTYSASHKDPLVLQRKLEIDFTKIKNYMDNNKLFLNSDKTHLLILDSAKAHRLHGDYGINLNTGSEIIEPSEVERLLGANVTNDFLWNNHLRDNSKSVISTLKTKNNALCLISHYSSFLVRKMIANGIIISHILYHIQMYSGSSEVLLSALQIQQNRAARLVCRLPWRTRTETLLKQIGWMSVRQMAAYYCILSLFKTQQTGFPRYSHEIISQAFKVKTRLKDSGGIKDTRMFKKSTIAQTSFFPKSIKLWNEIPSEIRLEKSEKLFSMKLRTWIKLNL